MQSIFADMLYKSVVVFFDDIMVFGRDEEEFLNNLRIVLTRLRKRRLRLKAKKCIAGATKMDAVGYVVSAKGRSMSPDRVTAVKNLPEPQDISELRAFLGKVNYFREYIDHCSDLTAPLSRLTKAGVPWQWGETEQKSFKELKDALTSEQILAYGTEEGTLVLRTDASGVGIGGVLLLRDKEGKDRPVYYFSETLTETQRRWSTYEQELFAVVTGMTKEPYTDLLKMKEFIVETDHRNLTFLDKVAAVTGNHKLNQWLMILMQFTFKIVHIAGSTNCVADVLSRFGHPRPWGPGTPAHLR